MAAHQAPPSPGFSRQEYWSGLPLPSPISYYMQQQLTISQSDCDMWWKWDFIWQPAQWLDREAPKHLPKPELHQKRVMVTGGLLLVWSITAFWIPVKPLHLRSTPSRSMECTENCNACSLAAGIGQQKMPSSSPQQYLTICHTSSASKVEWICAMNMASSAIFTWPLANQPLLQASWQHLAGKMLPWPDQQEAENDFQEFVESWSTDYNFFFFATGIYIMISDWQKCVDYRCSYFD